MPPDSPTKKAHIAIMAHNEEGNIAALLDRAAKEVVPGVEISRIVVVSSGSIDRTDEIVKDFAETDPRVRLITQDRRYGKCAAINVFLSQCPAGFLVVLLSGDILPDPGAIGELLTPLLQEEVGMTGGRPVPANDRTRFFGFACHLIWEVHHRIALKNPKLGEAVAFKKLMDSIPEELAVDEAALEAILREKGLKLQYCPKAVIRNQGPDNLRDFLKQRRRIQAGHLDLQRKLNYEVSTLGAGASLKALGEAWSWKPKAVLWTLLTCFLVYLGRILGWMDYHILGRRHTVWDIAESTKGDLSKKPPKG